MTNIKFRLGLPVTGSNVIQSYRCRIACSLIDQPVTAPNIIKAFGAVGVRRILIRLQRHIDVNTLMIEEVITIGIDLIFHTSAKAIDKIQVCLTRNKSINFG